MRTAANWCFTSAAIGASVQINGGTFSIGPGASVKGNFSVLENPKSTVQSQVCGATIGGSMQILANATPVTIGSTSAACPGNIISGNVTVSANIAATAIDSNTVGGSVFDLANLKPTAVFSNHIKGTLSCLADASITGGGNTAISKLGQCSGF